MVKRKKVTWADAELELPLASPAGGAAAATEDAAQSSGEAQPAVVVLPCDGLFDALTEDLLQDQGGWGLRARGCGQVVGVLAGWPHGRLPNLHHTL